MTKVDAKGFRRELLFNVLVMPIVVGILIFLWQSLSVTWVRFLLAGEIGFYLVFICYSAYQLINHKAFKRGLIIRNDERYQLIKDKANLTVYLVAATFLGACFSFDAMGDVLGTPTLSLAIWEFILVLVGLCGVSYALAKLYYQHRL